MPPHPDINCIRVDAALFSSESRTLIAGPATFQAPVNVGHVKFECRTVCGIFKAWMP